MTVEQRRAAEGEKRVTKMGRRLIIALAYGGAVYAVNRFAVRFGHGVDIALIAAWWAFVGFATGASAHPGSGPRP